MQDRVFDEMPEKNAVMYNTPIMGRMQCDRIEDLGQLFWDM